MNDVLLQNMQQNTYGDVNIGIEILYYLLGFIIIGALLIFLLFYLYFKFFKIDYKQKFVKISVVPSKRSIDSNQGYIYKFSSFIMNSYSTPNNGINNVITLEYEGGEVTNSFNIYVPVEYCDDYVRYLRSHYSDAVLIYNKELLVDNEIDVDYYSCFRHSNKIPLGKLLSELDVKQNVGAIINGLKKGEKLQMTLNFGGVLDKMDERKDLVLEAEDIKIGNISGGTNVYKKIFTNIRFLSEHNTSQIMSMGGLIGYIFEKKGTMINTRVKVGKRITTYYNTFFEKIYNFFFDFGAKGKQYFSTFSDPDGFYLTENEIAGIFNFVSGSKLETIGYTKIDPAEAYKKVKIEDELGGRRTLFGEFDYPGYEKKNFLLGDMSKRKHVYVIGKTGMGKSTILSNLMKDDIIKGKGFCLFDPNGDLAKDIMELIPKEREKDVVFVSPASPLGNVSLGIFDFLRKIRDEAENESKEIMSKTGKGVLVSNLDTLSSNLTSVIRTSSVGGGDMWGPRMDMLLKLGIKAVLGSSDQSTIADLLTFYNDAEFRKAILRRVTNPYERATWEKIESLKQEEVEQWYQPLRNRLMQYSSDIFLGLFSTTPKFDLNGYINSNKILIFDLAKGPTGESIGKFTGTVMFALIWEFIQLRAKIPKKDRKDFSVYIDEFQNYVSETFPAVLSEARKYGLSLCIAHQYLDQIQTSGILSAVIGNVGTVVALQIGVDDGKKLRDFFKLSETDLSSIPPFHAYVKSNDYSTDSFNIKTFPVTKDEGVEYCDYEELIEESYTKYGTKQDDLINNIGLYPFFKKNKFLPEDKMNIKEDLELELLNVNGFSLQHIGTDVTINDKNKLITYTIKESDIGEKWETIALYMGFNDYNIFEESCQTFNVGLKDKENKITKNFSGKSIVCYYGNLEE